MAFIPVQVEQTIIFCSSTDSSPSPGSCPSDQMQLIGFLSLAGTPALVADLLDGLLGNGHKSEGVRVR